jgi:hypothetical protein
MTSLHEHYVRPVLPTVGEDVALAAEERLRARGATTWTEQEFADALVEVTEEARHRENAVSSVRTELQEESIAVLGEVLAHERGATDAESVGRAFDDAERMMAATFPPMTSRPLSPRDTANINVPHPHADLAVHRRALEILSNAGIAPTDVDEAAYLEATRQAQRDLGRTR